MKSTSAIHLANMENTEDSLMKQMPHILLPDGNEMTAAHDFIGLYSTHKEAHC